MGGYVGVDCVVNIFVEIVEDVGCVKFDEGGVGVDIVEVVVGVGDVKFVGVLGGVGVGMVYESCFLMVVEVGVFLG